MSIHQFLPMTMWPWGHGVGLVLRAEPHGRQAGRTVGSYWSKRGPPYQTGGELVPGHLTWPGRLQGQSSRGPSLELRRTGPRWPNIAATVAGSRGRGPQRPQQPVQMVDPTASSQLLLGTKAAGRSHRRVAARPASG